MASLTENAFGALARGPLFTWMGTAAVYFAPGAGSGTACTVIVEPEPGALLSEATGQYDVRSATVRVRASEIATPARDGHFEIDGESLAITTSPVAQAGVWECRCGRKQLGRTGGTRKE